VVTRHPSIFQFGHVDHDGDTVSIHGWGLGLCAAGCDCHRHPIGGCLVIHEDPERGQLGLHSYVTGGCDCCTPWTAAELSAVLRDFTVLAELDITP